MSAELQDQLIEAIWREKCSKVRRSCSSGADVNVAGSKGMDPADEGSGNGESRHFAVVAGQGADVNRPGDHGCTPLHIAVDISIDGTIQTGGHPGEEPTEIIGMLLMSGASPFAEMLKAKPPRLGLWPTIRQSCRYTSGLAAETQVPATASGGSELPGGPSVS